ncbi:MAG: diguanylate cyclase [Pseudomonadota bacterium]
MPLEGEEARHIYQISDWVLLTIGSIAGLTGFALSQEHLESQMTDEMARHAQERRLFFATILQSHVDQTTLISSRPTLLLLLRRLELNPQDTDALAHLANSTRSMLSHGFSAIAYEGLSQRWASAGQFLEHSEIVVPIRTSPAATLLWSNGYILKTRMPIGDATGIAGYFVAEQPLPVLTKLHNDAIRWGESGDMAVCGLRGDDQLCFPFRWRKHGSTVPATLDGRPLPVTRAVRGETAVITTLDFRRERVVAAFGPIGETGLGMAIKMDLWELYSPLRSKFLRAVPFLILLLAAGVWLMHRQLRPIVKALADSRQQLMLLAKNDALTGLPNRVLFQDRIQQAMVRTQRTTSLMALFYVDVDYFKSINDTFGHATGDDVLRWVAAQLRSSIRACDVVCRIGGDEFTVILENFQEPSDGARIAQLLVKNVNSATPDRSEVKSLSISVGVAFYRGEEMTPDELLNQADTALYHTKQHGRNGFTIYDEKTHQGVVGKVVSV